MDVQLAPPWHDLEFLSPLSSARAAGISEFIASSMPETVVDVGCGWARLLEEVVGASPGASGIGIDIDGDALGEGRRRIAAGGLVDRITLIDADAVEDMPRRADSALCIGASQAFMSASDESRPLDYTAALTALRAALPRGGRLVYGESIWSSPPTSAATVALGGRDDELITIHELTDLAADNGFGVVSVSEATLDEWDEFESGYSACYARWLAEHDVDDPDAPEVRKRASDQRQAYFGGYRGVLGMAYLHLVAV